MQSKDKYWNEALRYSRAPLVIKSNVVAPAGFSWKYLRYRILRPLLKGYYKGFKLLHPDTPWTSQASILFFEKVLNKNMTGFEYGSGRSTLFFARRLRHLVSVEHHRAWHGQVQELIRKENLTNVEHYLVPPDEPLNGPERLGTDPGAGAAAFTEYAQFITRFPDASFDFILLDGRARVACAFNALPKLKPGGMLVLDNSERERYRPIHQELRSWPQVTTTMGLSDTTIWFKPLKLTS